MIIDAHAHMGTIGMWSGEADDLLRWADRAGIDKLIVSHMDAIFYDARMGNDALGQAMKRHPDRLAGYASFPSPYAGAAILEEITRCVETYGMQGLKIYSHLELAEHFSIAEPAWLPIIRHAASLGLPILAHANAAEVEWLATRVPEATILIAHLGDQAGGNMWQTFELACRVSNVILDLTSSQIHAGMVESAVAAAGPERVVFGTDLPLLEPEVQLQKVFSSSINEITRQRILGGNAARLFHLIPPQEMTL